MKALYHHDYDIGVKGQGQINLKSVLGLVPRTTLSFFNRGAPYFVQGVLMVCRFRIAYMTFESMVKVQYILTDFKNATLG